MGEVVAMFIGGIWGSLTLGAAAVITATINGALIGAAIGGISAAVAGGDIGKGMLYGAIGGAVTGGLISWASEGLTLGYGTSGTADVTKATFQTTSQTLDKAGNVIESTQSLVPESTKFLGLGEGATEVLGQTVSGVAKGLLTESPEGIDYGEQTAAQLALQKQAQEAAAKESALGREASMAQLQAQLSTQLDTSKATLAEQRRQYDVSATAAAARQRDAATGRGVLTLGTGTESTATYDPTLQNVLDNELYTNVAGA